MLLADVRLPDHLKRVLTIIVRQSNQILYFFRLITVQQTVPVLDLDFGALLKQKKNSLYVLFVDWSINVYNIVHYVLCYI